MPIHGGTLRRVLCGALLLHALTACAGKSLLNARDHDVDASGGMSSGGDTSSLPGTTGGAPDTGASGGTLAAPREDAGAAAGSSAGSHASAGSSAAGSSTGAAGSSGQDAGEAGGGSGQETAGAAGTGGHAGATDAGTPPPACDPIVFADPVFEHAVHDAIAHHSTPDSPPGQLSSADVVDVVIINAGSYGISSLAGAECLPNLAGLYLGLNGAPTNRVSDLTPLAGLKALREIDLRQNPVGDLSPLAGLSKLEFLDLTEALSDADLAPLGGLPHLRELRMSGDTVLDLTPLGRSPELRVVDLSRGQIQNPASVSALTQVTSLWLDGAMPSVSPLTGLTQLNGLGLASNGLTDISGLSGLVNLTVLGLSSNQVEDISVLAGMKQLSYLGLDGNRIADLAPLTALTQLTLTTLSGNRVMSLAPLVSNVGLGVGDTVWVSGNPFDCAAQAANIQALKARWVSITSDCP